MLLKKILCPTDYSDLSALAIAYARSFADTYRAELHLLHVVDEAYQYWMALGPNSLPIGPSDAELVEAARQGMKTFVEKHLADATTPCLTEVRLGRPYLEIMKYADEIGADLIIMGTHGRSGLTHMLLGSVTDKVVRKSHCAVLTVRPPAESTEAS
ncbi:MAG: universal stress protein [Phycisphaerae bacterium]|nr:universal stress protein [Phycisphaerae bacterium]NUQ46329.1 universal stress protein [Phycisphaerae bacterium]